MDGCPKVDTLSLAIGPIRPLMSLDMSQPRSRISAARVLLAIAGMWLLIAGGAQSASAAAGAGHDTATTQSMTDCPPTAHGVADAGHGGDPHAAAGDHGSGHQHGGGDPAGGDCCMAGCSASGLAADAVIARPVLVGPVAIDWPEAVLRQLGPPIGKPPKL